MSLKPKPKTRPTKNSKTYSSTPRVVTIDEKKYLISALKTQREGMKTKFIQNGLAKNKVEAEAMADMYAAAVRLKFYGYEYEDIDRMYKSITGERGWMSTMGY